MSASGEPTGPEARYLVLLVVVPTPSPLDITGILWTDSGMLSSSDGLEGSGDSSGGFFRSQNRGSNASRQVKIIGGRPSRMVANGNDWMTDGFLLLFY